MGDRKMCKWTKAELHKDPEGFSRAVGDGAYFCRKCARVAGSRKALCKPGERVVK